jgi:hypothetical protein
VIDREVPSIEHGHQKQGDLGDLWIATHVIEIATNHNELRGHHVLPSHVRGNRTQVDQEPKWFWWAVVEA